MKINFSLISHDRVVAETSVDEVLLPTKNGQIGVLPYHMNLITVMQTGEITTNNLGKLDHYAVFGGVAEINGESVVVLADRAEHVDEIDLAKAEEAKERAKKMLAESKNKTSADKARALLERNNNRIKTVRRHRPHHHHPPENVQ